MNLNTMLQERMQAEGLSLRRAAEKIKVSHSTIARAVNGEKLDVESMKRICDWLGVLIDDVLDIKHESDELNQQIALVLSIEPELEIVFRKIAEGIKDGRIHRDVLKEVAAFAAYRAVIVLEKVAITEDATVEVN